MRSPAGNYRPPLQRQRPGPAQAQTPPLTLSPMWMAIIPFAPFFRRPSSWLRTPAPINWSKAAQPLSWTAGIRRVPGAKSYLTSGSKSRDLRYRCQTLPRLSAPSRLEILHRPAALAFNLTVTNAAGVSSSDSCLVDVSTSGGGPSVQTGPDQTVSAYTNVTLNGSSSSDSYGKITTYKWTQIAGPTVSIINADTPTASFVAPDSGTQGATLVFELERAGPVRVASKRPVDGERSGRLPTAGGQGRRQYQRNSNEHRDA